MSTIILRPDELFNRIKNFQGKYNTYYWIAKIRVLEQLKPTEDELHGLTLYEQGLSRLGEVLE